MSRPRENIAPTGARTTFFILGMFDNTGRERVHRALECIEGVRDVHVSLHRSAATIRREPWCRPGDLAWSVLSEGFGVWLERDATGGMLAALSKRARENPHACRPSRRTHIPKGATP